MQRSTGAAVTSLRVNIAADFRGLSPVIIAKSSCPESFSLISADVAANLNPGQSDSPLDFLFKVTVILELIVIKSPLFLKNQTFY